ncbi:MAG: nucleoside hydrolase [Oscillospiraceae bacterium]|jgi:inosine-uridine nucleoside N-ribohydrolase|nr:nucleoside hydrolase [Oscillospiraceae bacterium]
MTPLRLVIDTDPGTDDAIALALAASLCKMDICAIVSSYGNVQGDTAFRNACDLAALLHIDAAMLHGSNAPFCGAFTATDYHGGNGLCGVVLPPAELPSQPEDVYKALYDIIAENAPVTYVTFAPLTNLAAMLRRFPDVGAYIAQVVTMGGGYNVFNMPHGTEYNFYMDGLAVREVLAAGLPLTLAPLDLTHSIALSEAELEDIVGHTLAGLETVPQTPYALLGRILFGNLAAARAHGEEGAIIHDACTLLYLHNPAACTTEVKRTIADNFGALSEDPKGAPLQVITAMDKTYAAACFREAFRALSQQNL